MVTSDTAPYVEAFRARVAAHEPDWLTASRARSIARFAELGFPSRREEAWRFTDLRRLQLASFPPDDPAKSGSLLNLFIMPPDLAVPSHRMVFVNGHFARPLSAIGALPEGAWLASTAETLAERPELLEAVLSEDARARQPFAALNAALFSDGFVLALAPGVVLDRPVEIVHFSETAERSSFHLRNAVLLGEESRACLVETDWDENRSSAAGEIRTVEDWKNAVTDLRCAAGSALTHIRVQSDDLDAINFALARVVLERKARYESFALTLGARLSRYDIELRFAGPDASCRLDGAFCLRGEQEATTATFVDHAVPSCTTRELWKGVVEDRAHGVFLGRIAVRPDAQKTDAQQVNKNLLLSRRAAIDTKPELDILADDVKCSHGATIGDLDEEALFYLRARGIPEDEARRLLIEAFAADALDGVSDAGLKAHLAVHLGRWLAREGRA